MGQGEVGGVIHRMTGTCWQLGLAVKVMVGWATLALTALTGLQTPLSPCRGLISGKEGLILRL